jgi:hypothetical protein
VIDPAVLDFVKTLIGVFFTVLSTILVAVTPYLVRTIKAYFVAKIAEAKSKLTSEQLLILQLVTHTVVNAVEKSNINATIKMTGEEKKEEALSRIDEELTRLGIPFDVRAAEQQIEAAINQGLEQPMAVISAESVADLRCPHCNP